MKRKKIKPPVIENTQQTTKSGYGSKRNKIITACRFHNISYATWVCRSHRAPKQKMQAQQTGRKPLTGYTYSRPAPLRGPNANASPVISQASISNIPPAGADMGNNRQPRNASVTIVPQNRTTPATPHRIANALSKPGLRMESRSRAAACVSATSAAGLSNSGLPACVAAAASATPAAPAIPANICVARVSIGSTLVAPVSGLHLT